MKILGVSLTTIIFTMVIVYIVRKWGNDLPLVRSIG